MAIEERRRGEIGLFTAFNIANAAFALALDVIYMGSTIPYLDRAIMAAAPTIAITSRIATGKIEICRAPTFMLFQSVIKLTPPN